MTLTMRVGHTKLRFLLLMGLSLALILVYYSSLTPDGESVFTPLLRLSNHSSLSWNPPEVRSSWKLKKVKQPLPRTQEKVKQFLPRSQEKVKQPLPRTQEKVKQFLPRSQEKVNQSSPWKHEEINQSSWEPRKVILFAYGRSGSSFTGDVIHHSPDVYYVYEPLHQLGAWRRSTDEKTDMLQAVLSCNFTSFVLARLYSQHLNRHSETQLLARCRKLQANKSHLQDCLAKAIATCQGRRTKLVKVIRYEMTAALDLMTLNPDLTLVYLIRDPRPMLLSAMKTFDPLTRFGSVEIFAKQTCNKMAGHLQVARDLFLLFPERVRFLRYEELSERPVHVTRNIYAFLRLNFTDDVMDRVIYQTGSNVTDEMKRAPHPDFAYDVSFDKNDTEEDQEEEGEEGEEEDDDDDDEYGDDSLNYTQRRLLGLTGRRSHIRRKKHAKDFFSNLQFKRLEDGSDVSELQPKTNYDKSEFSDLQKKRLLDGSDGPNLQFRKSFDASEFSDLQPRKTGDKSEFSNLGMRNSQSGSDVPHFRSRRLLANPYSLKRESSVQAANTWRWKMKWKTVQAVQSQCKWLMDLAGYRTFETPADLWNWTRPSRGAFTAVEHLRNSDLGVLG